MKFSWPLLLICLSGCGADVAGTAATVGTARKAEVEAAQNTKQQFQQRLDAATKSAQQNLERTENAVNP